MQTEILLIPSIDDSTVLLEIHENGTAVPADKYVIEQLIREYVHKKVLPSLRENHIEVRESEFEIYYDYRILVDYKFTSGNPCRIIWRMHPLEEGFKGTLRRAIKMVADYKNFQGFNTKAYEISQGKRVSTSPDIHDSTGMVPREDIEVEWIHSVRVKHKSGVEVDMSGGSESITNLYAKAIIELSRRVQQ